MSHDRPPAAPPAEIVEPGSAQLDRFTHELRALGKVRIDQAALWRAFAAAFPHRPTGPAERALFAVALQALAQRDVVRLPPARGTRWDRAQKPPVPRSIDLVDPGDALAQAGAGDFDWRAYPWHQRLHWVSDMRALSRGQIHFLRRVHHGLVKGWFTRPAPIKYRSLQLTGDEKRLAQLAQTGLFAPGKLDFALLGCFPDHPPLAWEPIAATGGALLVFENAGAFMLARQLLGALARPPYQLLAYGSGRTLPAGLPHLLTIGRTITGIFYVGDLDPLGLDIAVDARERAEVLGLPAVRPAPGWHLALLDAAAALGHPDGWPNPKSHTASRSLDELLAFLPQAARLRARAVLTAGRRIPEEVMGPAEMSALLKR